MGSFYPKVDRGTYMNVFYAMNIALDAYLTNRLLNGDTTRLVYASTDYALVKRSGQQKWNNANLPFINYKQSDKDFGGERQWFSFEAFSQGVYIPELRTKMRITPVTFNYDCTFWTSRDDDFQYASDMMLIDNSYETKLKFDMEYNGVILSNVGIVSFDLDASPRFSEQDWLEKNNIHALGLNPSIQTFLPVENNKGFCIPKRVLIDFILKKDLIPASDGEVITYEDALELTVDHFNQIVTTT